MKIAVIGASGHLGGIVTKLALDRGHQVTAMIRREKSVDPRAKVIYKDLFALTTEDIIRYDAVFSAYGSGFQVDPSVNMEVCKHYINIFRGTSVHLFHIVGAGCLFSDETHTARTYELPSHPDFLKGISSNATLGLQALEQSRDVHWTVVIPSIVFDGDAPATGAYEVSDKLQPLFGPDGTSIVTYADFACAVVDFMEQDAYAGKAVTIHSVQKQTQKLRSMT